MPSNDIQEMRRALQEQTERHHYKSAIVVNTKLEYGLARMMGSTMDKNVPTNRGVFYSVTEALDWLRPGQTELLERDYRHVRDKLRSV